MLIDQIKEIKKYFPVIRKYDSTTVVVYSDKATSKHCDKECWITVYRGKYYLPLYVLEDSIFLLGIKINLKKLSKNFKEAVNLFYKENMSLEDVLNFKILIGNK